MVLLSSHVGRMGDRHHAQVGGVAFGLLVVGGDDGELRHHGAGLVGEASFGLAPGPVGGIGRRELVQFAVEIVGGGGLRVVEAQAAVLVVDLVGAGVGHEVIDDLVGVELLVGRQADAVLAVLGQLLGGGQPFVPGGGGLNAGGVKDRLAIPDRLGHVPHGDGPGVAVVVVGGDGRRVELVLVVHLLDEVFQRLDRAQVLEDGREVRDGEQQLGGVAGGEGGRGLGVDLAPVLRLLLDDDAGVGGVELVDQRLEALDAVGRLLHMPHRDLDGGGAGLGGRSSFRGLTLQQPP